MSGSINISLKREKTKIVQGHLSSKFTHECGSENLELMKERSNYK
jgi:hypothetical protein